METLDVTKIEPRLKHPTIFDRFDALKGGEAFIIHNDHDPKPLYFQLQSERGNTFEWKYLKEGPMEWDVQISKMNTDAFPLTVGELVVDDYRKAEILGKFGIDFCCGGNKTLKEACDDKGIDIANVEEALSEVYNMTQTRQHDFKNWNLDFLIDYIVNTHHKYVEEALPMLDEFSIRVATVHGESRPELMEIARYFKGISEELKLHMHKEEEILFPYIKKLSEAKNLNRKIEASPFGSIENVINMMETEHTAVGEDFHKINDLSNSYTPPADGCSSYKLLYSKLDEFERDLHQHIHLENNILFPKAIKMEKELMG